MELMMNIFDKLFKKKREVVASNTFLPMETVKYREDPMTNYRDVISRLVKDTKDTSELFKFLYTEDEGDLGRATLLNILNKRRSFLCGEGVQVICESKKHRDFFDKFIKENKLDGSLLLSMAEQLEVLGFISVSFNKENKPYLNVQGKGEITVKLCDYRKVNDQHPVLLDIVKDAQSLELVFSELRILNNRGTKITPVIGGLQSNSDVLEITNFLQEQGWQTGQPLVTTAPNVQFISPNTDAVQNLVKEMTTLSQNISAKTGIPPHWLGRVEEMSNRAVAQEMYEVIEYTTAHSRTLLKECIYDILLKAQEIHGIKVNPDFEVDIPLLSASKFKSEITAVISAYQAGLITLEEARGRISGLPSVTPDELLEDNDMTRDITDSMNRTKESEREDEEKGGEDNDAQ